MTVFKGLCSVERCVVGSREVAAEQIPPSLLAADENAGSLNATVGMTSPKLIAPLSRFIASRLAESEFFRKLWIRAGITPHYLRT